MNLSGSICLWSAFVLVVEVVIVGVVVNSVVVIVGKVVYSAVVIVVSA